MAARSILLICNKFPYPPNDGGTIASLSMIRNLRREGWEVTVLAMNTHKHYVDLDELPQDIKDLASFYAIDVDIRLKPFSALANLLFSQKPYHIWRFSSKAFSDQVHQLYRYQQFDLIQLEGLYLTPYVPLLKELAPGVPIVLRAHNIEFEIWQRQAEQAKGRFRRAYLKETAKRISAYEIGHLRGGTYDAILPITQRDADRMLQLGVYTPMHVCNAGIDPELLNMPQGPKVEHPSIFYIGALDWTPNQEGIKWFVEKVWPILHQRFPSLTFYIAGRRISADLAGYDSKNQIEVLGEVRDAYAYMQSKSIMIVPLFAGSGMRVKIIEGMAMRKAIVATSIAAEGIPVKHGGNILIANTPEEFTDAISLLVEGEPMVRAMGDQALKFVSKNFDNRNIGRQLVAFYEENLLS